MTPCGARLTRYDLKPAMPSASVELFLFGVLLCLITRI